MSSPSPTGQPSAPRFARDPGPRPWRDAPIEEQRLARALHLSCAPLPDGRGHYLVGGGSEHHYVYLGPDATLPACDCIDHAASEALCAHAIRALLEEGDARVVAQLGAITRAAALAGRLIYRLTTAPIRPTFRASPAPTTR